MVAIAPATITPQFTFSAALADKMGALAGVYYLVRKLDDGSGWIRIRLNEFEMLLGKTRQTIMANLYEGQRRGYFWSIRKVNQSEYLVRYKSEARICQQLGIGLGAIARAPLSRIRELKFLATEATAEAIQVKSIKKAKQQISDDKSDIPIVQLESIFQNGQPCVNSRGATGVMGKGKRITYLRDGVALIGGKQATIAQSLDRHVSTIQRRLDNGYRGDRYIATIHKTQLAQLTDIPPSQLSSIQQECRGICDIELNHEASRLFIQTIDGNPLVFRASCSVYWNEDIELTRQSHKRKRLKALHILSRGVENEMNL